MKAIAELLVFFKLVTLERNQWKVKITADAQTLYSSVQFGNFG